MVIKLFTVALLAGLIAGVGATVFQMKYAVPLILEAEGYEVAEMPTAIDSQSDHAVGHAHDHGGDDAWAPADGLERMMSTFAANVFASIGFALLLVGCIHLWGGIANARVGVLWGAGGFASFSLAPFFGLPPELPGMVAADLAARQIWWVFTVLATSSGLALLVFKVGSMPTPLRVLLGLLLLVTPHAIGAPQMSSDFEVVSDVPAHLSSRFAVVALTHGMVLWLLLGAAVGWLFNILIGLCKVSVVSDS